MKNVLMLTAVAVLLLAGGASAGPINLVGTTWTWGSGQDPSAQLLNVSATDTNNNVGQQVGNVSLAAWQAMNVNTLINFDVAGVSNDPVSAVVAQYSPTQSVTFNNFLTDTGGSTNFIDTIDGGRGRQASSGTNYLQNSIRGASMSIYDSDPTELVSSVALVLCMSGGPGQVGGRSDGAGNVTFTMSDGSQAVFPYIDTETAANDESAFCAYTCAPGLSIVKYTWHRTGGDGDPSPANAGFDDLSFVLTPIATPEPATLSLLILGGFGMIGGAIRRRRRV